LQSLDVTTNAYVRNVLFVGKNGGGDSEINFYDDDSNAWRPIFWDNSANDWRVRDNTDTVRMLWHAGNDGSGSGLDADKLDGLQATQFARTDVGETFEQNVTVQGDMHIGKNGGGDSRANFHDDNTNTWRSILWDDSANDWRIEDNGGVVQKLWHGGNDGSGSGLDADRLDGLQSTSYARTDVGETFAHNVTVQGDMHIGKNGGGNSNLQFYDDNSNTWRALYWSDGGNEFRIEDQSGSLDAVTSKKNLGAHIASKSIGSVGTYAWLGKPTDGKITQGSTYAGSSLRYAGSLSGTTYTDSTAMNITNTAPSGTWRAMGRTDATSSRNSATLFLRIA
jgi:hypothetical protein